MRPKINPQQALDFHPSNLDITNAYYQKYEAVSDLLDENPKVLSVVHKDLKETLASTVVDDGRGGQYTYTSDTILRMILCQIIEGASLREIVVRVDDSHVLRHFIRIYYGPMLDFTTFCRLKNCIQPKTWEKINQSLAQYAVQQGLINGNKLRMDTTAVETNIHFPRDSALLWDTYRVMARLIDRARELDPGVVGNRRLQTRKAKKLQTKISRNSSKKGDSQEKLKPSYKRLIELTTSVCQWADDVRKKLESRMDKQKDAVRGIYKSIASDIAYFYKHGLCVIDQAARRTLDGEQVPNNEKLYSIFETHTELLRRGKAGKPNEFGHMVEIEQVDSKFITGYSVFDKKPVEHQLLEPALDRHKRLFGEYPDTVAADKGYYEGMTVLEKLEKKINVVSIAKKGRRTQEEADRENDPDFRLGQRFCAGVEGTISYLKRILGLFRCFTKGWEHYVSTIGASIFTHNLLILART